MPPSPRAAQESAPVTLAGLAAALDVGVPEGGEHVGLRGITHDSRAVHPGDVYAGLPGTRAHGAAFAQAAAALGAVALLTDGAGAQLAAGSGLATLVVTDPRAVLGLAAAFVHGHPAQSLAVLGVTGTNGKTTTAYLIESGLRAAGRRTGMIGTIETRIGEQTVRSTRTTPEATDLQALFGQMVSAGVDAVAMEVSSHALALHRVAGTRFAVVSFTHLGRDHLDFHHDLESYYQAKASLFTPEYAQVGVICVDDDAGRRLAGEAARRGLPVRTVTRAGTAGADWAAEQVQIDVRGSSFVLRGPDGERASLRVPLAGEVNVANAALAAVTLVAAGVSLPDAVAGIGACPGVPGRMQRLEAGQDFLALVDFAHTPEAIIALLASVRAVTENRVIIVLGAGGDRDPSKRPAMGAAAAAGADLVLLTSDNPRSEDPMSIIEALRSGIGGRDTGSENIGSEEIVVEPDRGRAIAMAVARARPGDAVVVAGKGHEQGQEIAGLIRPFDDVEVLRSTIQTRSSTCST